MTEKHTCEFCKRQFHAEKNLISHNCEKKRRFFKKDDPSSRFGFLAWARFYELTDFSSKKKKNNFKDFINSRYYTSFLKFGRYIIDINAIEPAKFIDFVIKNNLPIDRWTHDFVYEQYVRELTKKETPEQACERMILLMQQWSMQTGEPWQDFFRKINTNLAVMWIRSGRMSPWLLYNVDSALDLIDRCSLEQQDLISQFAPVAQWKIKFMKSREAIEWIKKTMKDAGV
jgi:hypothetical protein